MFKEGNFTHFCSTISIALTRNITRTKYNRRTWELVMKYGSYLYIILKFKLIEISEMKLDSETWNSDKHTIELYRVKWIGHWHSSRKVLGLFDMLELITIMVVRKTSFLNERSYLTTVKIIYLYIY